MLATVEKMVSHNLKVTIENSNSVIDTLKNTLEIIQNNRDELNAQILEAREVNGYGPDEDELQGEKENFVEDASDGDFEEEDFADKNTGKALEEDDEFDEEDDDELFDLTEKFSFKKRNK